MSSKSYHLYHIVDVSPWPLTTSISAFGLTTGTALSLHFFQEGPFLLLVSFFNLILSVSVWWRDVIRESAFEGHHTTAVQISLRLGFVLFIVSEIMFFSSFFWTFFHSSLAPTIELGNMWPPVELNVFNPWDVPLLNTIILVLSGAAITWSHFGLTESLTKNSMVGLNITIFLAFFFTVLQLCEYTESTFSMSDGAYGSIFFMSTGFHGFHVIVGTIFILITAFRVKTFQLTKEHHVGFISASWYWHFVDVVWLFLFVAIYWWGNSTLNPFDLEVTLGLDVFLSGIQYDYNASISNLFSDNVIIDDFRKSIFNSLSYKYSIDFNNVGHVVTNPESITNFAEEATNNYQILSQIPYAAVFVDMIANDSIEGKKVALEELHKYHLIRQERLKEYVSNFYGETAYQRFFLDVSSSHYPLGFNAMLEEMDKNNIGIFDFNNPKILINYTDTESNINLKGISFVSKNFHEKAISYYDLREWLEPFKKPEFYFRNKLQSIIPTNIAEYLALNLLESIQPQVLDINCLFNDIHNITKNSFQEVDMKFVLPLPVERYERFLSLSAENKEKFIHDTINFCNYLMTLEPFYIRLAHFLALDLENVYLQGYSNSLSYRYNVDSNDPQAVIGLFKNLDYPIISKTIHELIPFINDGKSTDDTIDYLNVEEKIKLSKCDNISLELLKHRYYNPIKDSDFFVGSLEEIENKRAKINAEFERTRIDKEILKIKFLNEKLVSKDSLPEKDQI